MHLGPIFLLHLHSQDWTTWIRYQKLPVMESDVDTADGETVILNCIDSNESRLDGDREEIVISTAEVSRWDLTLLGHRSIIKIKANRQRQITFFLFISLCFTFTPIKNKVNFFSFHLIFLKCRLIRQSSYFHGLLSGSFRYKFFC